MLAAFTRRESHLHPTPPAPNLLKEAPPFTRRESHLHPTRLGPSVEQIQEVGSEEKWINQLIQIQSGQWIQHGHQLVVVAEKQVETADFIGFPVRSLGSNDPINEAVADSPRQPAPAIRSGTPSPSMSPRSIETPPRELSPNGKKVCLLTRIYG